MNIGIDGNEANIDRKVGIGEYAFELLIQFSNSKLKTQNSKFVVYLKNKAMQDLPKENQNWQYRVIGPKRFWTQFALPVDLYFHKERPDVFFSPTHYAPRFSPIPTIISIMDLSYIHYPYMFKKSDLYQLKNWTLYSVQKSKKIITISKSSKNDIIGYYKLDNDKVVVVYPGIKEKGINLQAKSMDNSKKLRAKYNIRGKYILFVGTLQPRKNIVRLIEAFGKILSEFSNSKEKELELIIVGKKGWFYQDILNAPQKNNIEKNVKFLDFVENEELPALYKEAVCFVLPSLYEGFGLPVLEAMQFGCPVLASNISSLPEAGADAAVYFDPYNVNDIADKLKKVIENEELRKEMREKGFRQIKKFSWEKAATETLDIIKKVAG